MAKTIEQTAIYAFTTKSGVDSPHGAAYGVCYPEHSPEFVGAGVGDHEQGVEHWTVEGVVMPDALERLFDTDESVVSYYEVAPLVVSDGA